MLIRQQKQRQSRAAEPKLTWVTYCDDVTSTFANAFYCDKENELLNVKCFDAVMLGGGGGGMKLIHLDSYFILCLHGLV